MKFESFKNWLNEEQIENSIWRSASQEWLHEFINNRGFIDHRNNFISFSFDSESGGMDSFGNREVVIEFNESKILKQAKSQGYGDVKYTEDWMESHPDVCLHITGYKSKEDYYKNINVENDEEAYINGELTWDMNITDYEHEEEIVMKQLKDEDGLIKNVTFYVPANKSLLNKLKRKGVSVKLTKGVDDTQQKIIF